MEINRVKTILVSQPEPPSDKSPYTGLSKKHKVQVDFRPFVHVEGVDASEFRKQKVHILEHTAIIFTSRYAVDHFFRLCKETRVNVPETMKYFCMSEAVAYYLQNYIPFRKRKIFIGKLRFVDLVELIKKHRQENFLLPVSDIYKESMPKLLNDNGIKYTISIFYKTVASDLSDLTDITYDILVFFSPSGIVSLLKNFTDFKQNDTRIAAFGKTTADLIKDHKLKLNIPAPTPECPSMIKALDEYITEANKRRR
jgi:uroporphyrinogen-III synthase